MQMAAALTLNAVSGPAAATASGDGVSPAITKQGPNVWKIVMKKGL